MLVLTLDIFLNYMCSLLYFILFFGGIILKKILKIILSLSLVFAETITYFVFDPKDIDSFFFIWLLISIILFVYLMIQGPQTGIHVLTSGLGTSNDSMNYLNLSTEIEKISNGKKRKNITFAIERNLFTIINGLTILANLIIYIIIIKKLY